MPFLTTTSNFQKVAGQHLEEGEMLRSFFGAGRRVVALTDKRLFVSTFPFFFSPKLLLEAKVEDIEGLDTLQSKPLAMDLLVTARGDTQRTSLPTAYGDVPGSLAEVFEAIREQNPRAGGASYFEEGEVDAGSLPTDKGVLKVTNKHVFLIAAEPAPDGGPRIASKLTHDEVEEFDFYEAKMGSLKLFMKAGVKSQVYHVKASTLDMNPVGEAGVVADGNWVPARMAAALPRARPEYLLEGEQIELTMRAGTGALGSVKVPGTLRLTSQRLLYLTPDDDGGLSPEQSLDRSAITAIESTTVEGDYNQPLYFELEVTADGEEIAWKVPSEHQVAYEKLVARLR